MVVDLYNYLAQLLSEVKSGLLAAVAFALCTDSLFNPFSGI